MIKVRKARLLDSEAVYLISNQKSVRAISFSQANIPKKVHQKWFGEIIKNRDTLFLLVILEKQCVGFVRFTIENTDASISIAFLEEFQGKGIGSKSLQLSLSYLNRKFPKVARVIALVLKNNQKSELFFRKNKFILKGDIMVEGKSTNKFVYEIKN